MKILIYLLSTGIALGTLSACASISNAVDDDVYVTKGVEIPVNESLNDETSYTSYKYNKERENGTTQYVTNNYGNNYGYRTGYNNYGYNPYGYSPYYGYQPHYGYNSHHRPWRYVPGYGRSYVGYSPHFGFSYSSGFGFGMGYGYSPYGYSPYGYGYGNGYGYNPYGYNPYNYNPYNYNPYGYNNPYQYNGSNNGNHTGNSSSGGNWGNSTSSSTTHYRGPRGSSGGGVVTRNNAPGVLKTGTFDSGNTKNQLSRGTTSENFSGKNQKINVQPVEKENIITRSTDNNVIRDSKNVQSGSVNPAVSPVRGTVRGNTREVENNLTTPVRVSPSNENKSVSPSNYNNRGTAPITPSRSNPTIQREAPSPVRNSGSGNIRQENPSRNQMQSQPSQRVSPQMNQQSRPSSPSASPSNRGSGSNSGATSRPSSSGTSRPSGGR
jgi:hypothetical protein